MLLGALGTPLSWRVVSSSDAAPSKRGLSSPSSHRRVLGPQPGTHPPTHVCSVTWSPKTSHLRYVLATIKVLLCVHALCSSSHQDFSVFQFCGFS